MDDKSEPVYKPTKKVIIIGGGLSALSAARNLLARGYDITLVEKRRFLGGRAFSFHNRDVEVDNGQHVFLGCNTFYIDFLRTIGTLGKTHLQKSLRVEVILNGTTGTLSSCPFLGPLHLLPAFLRYPHLGFKDKFLVSYGILRMMFTNRKRHIGQLESETGYEWLKRQHQTERAINNLWNLIVLPALNDDVRNANANMTLMVLQKALLRNRFDSAIGLSKVGLSSLTGDSAQRYIVKQGGEIMLGKTVTSILSCNGLVTGVQLADGLVLKADSYLSAIPFDALLKILPKDLAHSKFFSMAMGLDSSPIVNLHIWYDRKVMTQVFTAFLDTHVQWVFNKTLIREKNHSRGQYLCISLSSAWQYIEKPKEDLQQIFTNEMRQLFPKARDAKILKFLVVKERKATFRSSLGSTNHRLPQTTPIPNFFLAGDWTKTGWPSTMESAVVSGVLATKAIAKTT